MISYYEELTFSFFIFFIFNILTNFNNPVKECDLVSPKQFQSNPLFSLSHFLYALAFNFEVFIITGEIIFHEIPDMDLCV